MNFLWLRPVLSRIHIIHLQLSLRLLQLRTMRVLLINNFTSIWLTKQLGGTRHPKTSC